MYFTEYYIKELMIDPKSSINTKFKQLVRKIFVKNGNKFNVKEVGTDDINKITSSDIQDFKKLNLLVKSDDGIRVSRKGVGFALGMPIDAKDGPDCFSNDDIVKYAKDKEQKKIDYDREIFTGWIELSKNGTTRIDSWDGKKR